jgi:Tfp pilus assembly protein PilO
MPIDQFQALIAKHARAASGVLLLVGVLAIRSWIVTPHLASLEAAQQYRQALHKRSKTSRAINHELRAERTRLETIEEEYASFSDMVFRQQQADEFLSDLEVFCGQSDCVVTSISFMDEQDPAGPIIARCAVLTVRGTYDSFLRLIKTLTTRQEKVWIDELRMMASPQGYRGVVCRLRITIYTNPNVETTGHADTAIPH